MRIYIHETSGFCHREACDLMGGRHPSRCYSQVPSWALPGPAVWIHPVCRSLHGCSSPTMPSLHLAALVHASLSSARFLGILSCISLSIFVIIHSFASPESFLSLSLQFPTSCLHHL